VTAAIPPLALVAAEIRTSYNPSLTSDSSLARLQAALPEVPIPQREHRQTVTIGAEGQQAASEAVLRLLSRESNQSLTLTATAITLETTNYPGFEAFAAFFARIVAEVAAIAPPAAVERVGVRYVNEVRDADSIQSIPDWNPLVNSSLLAPAVAGTAALHEAGFPTAEPTVLQTTASWQLPDHCGLTGRFTPLVGPPVIGGLLRRTPAPPESGPFFVVDLDAYWPTSQQPSDSFAPDRLTSLLETLHAGIEAAFEWATTPELRGRTT
jgi:uncharacterized protein (TIGR04255 family)